jgi:hypothetical protein
MSSVKPVSTSASMRAAVISTSGVGWKSAWVKKTAS